MKPVRKKKASINLSDVAAIRADRAENQATFWHRVGCTQSAGSRYENERRVPTPIAILLGLILTGVITDEQIAAARVAVSR